jgi:hypothetical protein
VQSEGFKGKSSNESCRLAAKAATAGGRFADHQMKGGGTVLYIEIRQRAATNEALFYTDSFIEGKRQHLGGGESITNKAFHLVAAERLVAVTSEPYEFRIGIPTLKRWEGLGGVWAQRHVLAQEDRLVSADPTLVL